ncbi:hypothetical protein, partial [Yersinia pestis]|uniref:hypothetical protein n=3 Tax=Yersinia pseudotuberculosis complex TaxID=1649845 RepID=UPI001ED9B1CE
ETRIILGIDTKIFVSSIFLPSPWTMIPTIVYSKSKKRHDWRGVLTDSTTIPLVIHLYNDSTI